MYGTFWIGMVMELNENPDERLKQVAGDLLNRETTSNGTAEVYDAFSKYYDQASIHITIIQLLEIQNNITVTGHKHSFLKLLFYSVKME